MSRRSPGDLYTPKSLAMYVGFFALGVVLGIVVLVATSNARLAIVVVAACTFVAVAVLRPRKE
jgi:hypothetical protein